MKMSKDDLIKKINDKVMDEDVKIELMEDITDSFEEGSTSEEDTQRIEELEEKYKTLEEKYKTLQEKYKERFLQGTEIKKEEKNEDDGLEEKEVIDIKEI